MAPDFILIHWLDPEMCHYAHVRRRLTPDALRQHVREYMLLGLLMPQRGVVVPGASLFENPSTVVLLEEMAPFREAGLISFAGAEPDAAAFLDSQAELYAADGARAPSYAGSAPARLARLIAPHWRQKRHSTTQAVLVGWTAAARDRDRSWLDIVERTAKTAGTEATLARVPTLLNGRPPLPDYAAEVVEAEAAIYLDEAARSRINTLVSRLYVRSHAEDYAAAVMTDVSFLGSDTYVDHGLPHVSAGRFRTALKAGGLGDAFAAARPEAVLNALDHAYVRTALDDLSARAASPGKLFSPQEIVAIRRRRPVLCPGRFPRSQEGGLRSHCRRYVEGIASANLKEGRAVSNTFKFGDHSVFAGNTNFGGTQYTVGLADDARSAARAVTAAVVASDEAFQDLARLDAAVSAITSVTSDDLAAAVAPELARAKLSRRSEIAETLATGTASGVLVQGVLAALKALGI